MGYDVWIGCTRGRSITLGHTSLDLTDEAQAIQYWDFTYDQIGIEDINSMVDLIIADRVGNCDKVTLVTHSTAANSSLVAATSTTL